ncbi:SMP-30/gluconolactonase/LRE family protein [Microbacterium sp. NPDC057650]|uniref:SMP-30/gluconolactonase/LRE family protein n=1 Tax=unclassified Microbacterium TaxID=2609290 RepID=UPI0036714C09
MSQVKVLRQAENLVGEGPVWDSVGQALYWVDILSKQYFRDDLKGGFETTTVDRHIGAVLPTQRSGELLLMVRDGFQLRSPEGEIVDLCLPLADVPTIRFNDGKVDPRGRAYGGTMPYDWQSGAEHGELYRLHVRADSAQLTTVESPVKLANGLGWSPDGATLYFIDSGDFVVYAYDYDVDSGKASGRRVLASVEPVDGLPDGLTVDAEGAVWVAMHGAGRVRRYLPGGELDREIVLPATQLTSVCFAGPDLDLLIVTSARLGLTDEALATQPLAGSVFSVDAGVRGLPSTPWRVDA